MDTDLFFPAERDVKGQREALRICEPCTVKRECLDWALEHQSSSEHYGIFGGMAPVERALLSRRAK
jgi:WhiB family redox-sensing transcriptional regulator